MMERVITRVMSVLLDLPVNAEMGDVGVVRPSREAGHE
jgi:hypothetical protein